MVLASLSETVRVDPRSADSNQSLQRALVELTRADACARSEQCDPWEFAVEMEQLLAEGLTSSDLRWLVKKGYVEHAVRSDTAPRQGPPLPIVLQRQLHAADVLLADRKPGPAGNGPRAARRRHDGLRRLARGIVRTREQSRPLPSDVGPGPPHSVC